jgi:hypothetical protein
VSINLYAFISGKMRIAHISYDYIQCVQMLFILNFIYFLLLIYYYYLLHLQLEVGVRHFGL